jgi:hypothetical protein
MTGTVTPQIMTAVYNALKPAGPTFPTPANDKVYLPLTWPTDPVAEPILKISVPEEIKDGLGKSGIQFTTGCTLEVIGEVSATAKPDNAEANDVWTALGMFQRDVELAVIGNPVLFGGGVIVAGEVTGAPGLVERLKSVHTKYAVNSEGQMTRGAFSMTFDFEFYQGTEDFQTPPTVDIDRFHIYADLINVADPSGTYDPPMDYTPTPAPRTQGPDGRIEGEAEILLPVPED